MIIARGQTGANCEGVSGNSNGSNLSDDGTCGFGTPGDPISRDNVPDLLLGPLADNGGLTRTHLPQPGSAGVDHGMTTGAPARDQRRHLRVGVAPDVGAAEFSGYAPPHCDFDVNGLTDYLLFNSSTRASAIWYLNGNAFAGGSYGPSLPAGWTLISSADFDLNGSPDYVLFNSSTRRTAIWYLSNATFVSGSLGPTLPPGWNLVAAADINLDGWPDYLLFNPTTRQTAV